jgi:pilus assembly protein CpaC
VDNLSRNDSTFEVYLSQGRVLTLKEDLTRGKGEALVAVGDPTVIDFVVINARQVRIIGQRLGVTDLSLSTAAGKTWTFEVHVVADLEPLRGRLRCLFPDARLKLSQLREQIMVEGLARDTAQVTKIMDVVRNWASSVQVSQARAVTGTAGRTTIPPGGEPTPRPDGGGAPGPGAGPDAGGAGSTASLVGAPAVLNLIRVPGAHQVLLKVRVAELNRTALRQIGADFLALYPKTGAVIGTQIGGANVSAQGMIAARKLMATATTASSPSTTAFGIFEGGDFEIMLSALRKNSVLKILAEPNLVALNGHQATFLAGGEYPVPVPQFGAGAGAATVTVQFKEFGVRLGFLPFILDDEVIRLSVAPEVSEPDFTIAATLVPGGSPVPGLSSRKAQTTVELRQGQTLMVAGLLQLTLNGNTSRIPGLGDLPILGPFFSNTSTTRTEKELVVLVTPYLVEPMTPKQIPPTPGDEVNEPNDLELFLLNRIEGRTGRDTRSTTAWSDPYNLRRLLHLQSKSVCGPSGFTD